MQQAAGLYLHVPFCKTKCPYCDFYSITTESLAPAWAAAVQKEALCYPGVFPLFDTLYLGGGTPSIIADGLLADLFEFIFHHFTFASQPEVTFEMNPDDVTEKKLHFLRSQGVNRISIGVQSFCDHQLRALKRRHSARQAELALGLASQAGFTSLGIDLMYGLPGQSEADWLLSLEKAVSFHPEHLSCYQLTFCSNTPFGRAAAGGIITPPDEETARSLFLRTSQFLQGCGYLHYEVSNYARSPVLSCRHNCKYWDHTPYLGLGPSAHSLSGNRRWWNVKSVSRYCALIDKGAAPLDGGETLSPEQLDLESLALGFRTAEGIDRALVAGRPHADEILRDLLSAGLITMTSQRIAPTIDGMLVADSLPLLFVSQE